MIVHQSGKDCEYRNNVDTIATEFSLNDIYVPLENRNTYLILLARGMRLVDIMNAHACARADECRTQE